jgi:REP element-mobilizing transposase RayT
MSRQARQKSESGIYHIIIRGINKQVIFEDDEDREKFIGYLQYYKKVASYIVYGYCLMDNHIHLLIKEGKEPIGHTMKRIGVSYVGWYNRKYDRVGHLFQDRFKSEVVETDEYLLTVLRYIHQNPIKAGKEKNVVNYKWSSYAEYIGQNKIIETGFILDIFAEEREKSISSFKKYMNEQADDNCIEMKVVKRITDEDAKKMIQKYANVKMATELQNMERTRRDEIIRRIKEVDGVSTRQIARVTGMSQTVISKA